MVLTDAKKHFFYELQGFLLSPQSVVLPANSRPYAEDR